MKFLLAFLLVATTVNAQTKCPSVFEEKSTGVRDVGGILSVKDADAYKARLESERKQLEKEVAELSARRSFFATQNYNASKYVNALQAVEFSEALKAADKAIEKASANKREAKIAERDALIKDFFTAIGAKPEQETLALERLRDDEFMARVSQDMERHATFFDDPNKPRQLTKRLSSQEFFAQWSATQEGLNPAINERTQKIKDLIEMEHAFYENQLRVEVSAAMSSNARSRGRAIANAQAKLASEKARLLSRINEINTKINPIEARIKGLRANALANLTYEAGGPNDVFAGTQLARDMDLTSIFMMDGLIQNGQASDLEVQIASQVSERERSERTVSLIAELEMELRTSSEE